MAADSGVIEQAARPAFRFGRYLLWLSVLTCVLYPLPYFLIRAPYYDRWSTSPYGRDLDFGMNAAHIDADVLIYGDSTALYGLDPDRMSRELGVKVFNIPNLLPALRVTGDLGLRRYLAANKPPRLIVLYLSPWDLDYTHYRPGELVYDGEEMLLRYGTASDIFRFAKKDPTAYLQFPFIFHRLNSLYTLGYWMVHTADPRLVTGHRDLPPYPSLPADCVFPAARAAGHLPMKTVQELYARYNTAAVPAYVYIAPIPACGNAGVVTADDYAAAHAVAPRLLPGDDFAQDGYYSHPQRGHVDEVTDQLVERIRPLLGKP